MHSEWWVTSLFSVSICEQPSIVFLPALPRRHLRRFDTSRRIIEVLMVVPPTVLVAFGFVESPEPV